jgi:hypothetical protein
MTKVEQLLQAVHAVSDDADVHFRGTPDVNKWICLVYVGRDVILFESTPGTLGEVVDAALGKLRGMSQQIRAVTIPPDDPGSEDPSV